MKIEDILNGIQVIRVAGKKSEDISSVEFDSRNVKKDSLFVAVKGYKTDGHEFINSAVSSGASAIICETLPENPDKNIYWITVADSAKALGIVASNYFGNPTSSLRLVGVTGTNGKTSTTQFIAEALTDLGLPCGVIGTIGVGFAQKLNELSYLLRQL